MNRTTFSFMIVSLLIAVFVTSAGAQGQAQAHKGTSMKSEADQEVHNAILLYYQAWNTFDTEKAAAFYAKDADSVFYDLAPMKYLGWEQYRAGAQKLFLDNLAHGKFGLNDDLKITRHGNVAWATLTARLSATMKDGKSMDLDYRHTMIWEKRAGKWLVVHEHLSVPLPMEKPAEKGDSTKK